jgi:hypothetical protein
MAAITAAVDRPKKGIGKTRRYLMAASTAIVKGALVSVDATTGLAKNAVAGAVDGVVGVATENVTSAASGSYYIQVEYDCEFRFAASSIAQGNVGDLMLVVDNNTVDETSAGSAVVGILTEFVSSTLGWVYVPGPSIKHAV